MLCEKIFYFTKKTKDKDRTFVDMSTEDQGSLLLHFHSVMSVWSQQHLVG